MKHERIDYKYGFAIFRLRDVFVVAPWLRASLSRLKWNHAFSRFDWIAIYLSFCIFIRSNTSLFKAHLIPRWICFEFQLWHGKITLSLVVSRMLYIKFVEIPFRSIFTVWISNFMLFAHHISVPRWAGLFSESQAKSVSFL